MLTEELPVNSNDIPKTMKRRWIPWYQLPVLPICPNCRLVCLVGKTVTGSDGKAVQHRYCRRCSFSLKVPIAASEAK